MRDSLGELEQLAMLAVARLGDEAYGATICRELGQTAARQVAISTVYVTLVRLENKGFVVSRRAAPTPVRGGKSKRFFRLTPEGMNALRECRAALDRMWEGIDPTVQADAH